MKPGDCSSKHEVEGGCPSNAENEGGNGQPEAPSGAEAVPILSARLYKVEFIHYAPKGEQSGLVGWHIATSDEQVLSALEGSHGLHFYDDDFEEEEEGDRPLVDIWRENDPRRAEVQRAREMGLTVEVTWGAAGDGTGFDVRGPRRLLTLWAREDLSEVADAYYGCTRVRWDAGAPISDDDAWRLIRLGVATDLRETTPTPGGDHE